MEFAHDFPAEFKDWHTKSNSIINLSVKSERALWDFCTLLDKKGLRYSKFVEPDIGYALTAVAIVPSPLSKKVCSGIPLSGKYNSDPVEEQVKLDRLKATKELVWNMQECFQAKGLNMIDHGLAVKDRLFDLVNVVNHPETPAKFAWRYPSWFFQHASRIAYNLRSALILDRYATMHDCGKPACKTPSSSIAGDVEVRYSYPDHAEVSAREFERVSDMTLEDNRVIANLIRRDMDIHTLKTEGIAEFCRDREDAVTLLLTGLAEIHANAEMFGGMQSDSFKIKFKQLEKKGALICKYLFGDAV